MGMSFDRFLPCKGNEPLRQELWGYYKKMDTYFGDQLGYSLKISYAREGQPYWHLDNGCSWLEILYDQDDKGSMFHEATHELFHFSMLHGDHNRLNRIPHGGNERPDHNEAWGEAFCEAVRWLLETTYFGDSRWLQSLPSRVTGGEWRIIQALRILNFTGRSLDSFAHSWNKLKADYDETGDFLRRTIPIG